MPLNPWEYDEEETSHDDWNDRDEPDDDEPRGGGYPPWLRGFDPDLDHEEYDKYAFDE